MKPKKRIILISIVYTAIGLVLCALSGCATFKQTFSLSFPMVTERKPFTTYICQCDGNHILVSTKNIRGSEVHRSLDITTGEFKLISFYDAKKHFLSNPPIVIDISATHKYCQILLGSNEEIQKAWGCARKSIASTKKRTRVISQDYRLNSKGEMVVASQKIVKLVPSYHGKHYYLSCGKYETANISWSKLPSDTIIALEDRDKGDLYVKKIKDKRWTYHFLGVPARKPIYYTYKTMNAIFLPVSVPYTCIAELLRMIAWGMTPLPH